MASSFSIDYGQARVHLVVAGEVTFAEIRVTLDAIVSDPLLAGGFTVLADHRNIARPLSPGQMSEMAGLIGELFPRLEAVRWAIVAGSAPSYGMMRVLAASAELAANMQVRVFFDIHAAEQWLSDQDSDSVA